MKKLSTNRPTNSKVTYFYTADIEQIETLLTELGLIPGAKIEPRITRATKEDYVWFGSRLTDEQLDLIKSQYVDRSKPKSTKIIRGFKGCLITKPEFF